MGIYSPPPPAHSPDADKPTLLVCWWTTLFSTTIILLRMAGRFIRTERLFKEDKVAGFAMIPLLLRMGCVHYALIYGTNNAAFPDPLTDQDATRKSVASGLVLVSRILFAATLWILKTAILEFFKRLTSTSWKQSYDTVLLFIRCTLGATFVAVVISDLTECQPFNHYWQVVPDPGPQCRQGYVHLITMAVCNVTTDLLLVIFPVQMVLTSHMKKKKKIQLVILFSLSLAVVGATLYRVPNVIWANGSQQLRSLLASVEILFATTAANALVLGSFVRDRGVKKAKFRHGSIAAESMGGSERRPTLHRHWGSDEDLVRDLGLGVNRELRDDSARLANGNKPPLFSPAPMATKLSDDMRNWRFPQRKPSNGESEDSLLSRDQLRLSRSNSTTTPRRVSFFDVGGLLDNENPPRNFRDSYNSSVDPLARSGSGSGSTPSPTIPASTNGFRRGSQTFLQDLGGLFHQRPPTLNTPLSPITQHSREASLQPRGPETPALIDEGGLLK